MAEPSQPRPSNRSLAIVVGLMVAVALVAIFLLRVGAASKDDAPPTDPKVASIQLLSLPTGATVRRADDGGVLGVTPFIVDLPRSDTDVAVVVHRDGYQDRHVTVPVFSLNGRVEVTLTAIGADAAPLPPQPPDGWSP
jgi:hypothetical protein